MEAHSILIIIIFIFLIILVSECASRDTISANQEIKDGETIVSQGEMYEMGFFSPGNSKNRYLGIWYKKISTCTVVWVANRGTPITDKSSIFKVTKEGNLIILSGGGNTVVWSSNSTAASGNALVVEVQLLDTGNLVVWDKKKDPNRNLIWQSFDYPGDTYLPGMKFGKNFETGIEWRLTSWKSPDDPAPGVYHYYVEIKGYPQILTWRGEDVIARFGPWNGLGFSGFPTDISNAIYSVEFVNNEKDVYYKYELKSSVIMRVVLTWEGKTLVLHWIERIQEWVVYGDASVDSCGRFALCGPYGSCSINTHPPCSCMEGFVPKNQQQWDASDWSSGCKRKKALNCGNTDGFRKIAGGVKVPDTRKSYYNVSMSLGECEMTCKRDCSCTAYASLDISNGGSGCLLWFHELMDTREYDSKQDLYLKMAASELQGQVVHQSGPNKWNMIVIVFLLMSLFLLLPALAYASRKMKKGTYMKRRGHTRYMFDDKKTSMRMELLDNLQFFNLTEVARATDNFNVSNKIGEGGFGPVYKGVLEDGQEVAVKRLSETSQQGLDEFKNELTCIAKLQHRNLVKLLGYCIHEYELLLIYEYMPNNSLDFSLFDEARSLMLDWPKRFVIINGMARGILYLHQDSRLQIIHRDLKAGNILLDSNMNPKISDFGLARKFVGHDDNAKTKKVVGTYGYISPEYAVHGRFSIKSDVFSFGVLVLEIICGKKNREFTHENHGDNLLGHAWRLYKENKASCRR
ncbi:G-type lectin S-receptor-like serine/threonine-protein kinase At4g27290 isoform X2 [Rutidosis leptorrhynchoides]|uniref:G-type lectin S-receptor-like serine/threonine-protein kinase At4g27290 isoform X2 n=1 Tax=Rutidosis leptorrhynchoides TaxID=125765 RepID=UPI003A99F6EB